MTPAESATDRDTRAVPSSMEGAEAMLSGSATARLDFLTVLRVSGRDALPFLQGQLTADLEEVSPATSRLAAWCSPKGRVLAVFRVLADPAAGYRLICERWFLAALLARMRMFILRSHVHIDEAGEAVGIAGVAGTLALPARVHAWAGTAEVDDATELEGLTIVRVPGRHRRFLVAGPSARIASLAPQGTDRGRHASPGAWRLADISAGVVRITAETSDTYLPQMLDLDRIRAVSFDKGCYVGQEIVARTQHLGRIKRRMVVGRAATHLDIGAPILDTANDGSSKVGDVVAVEPHPDGGSVACVVINIAAMHSPALIVGGADGPPIRVSPPDSLELTV